MNTPRNCSGVASLSEESFGAKAVRWRRLLSFSMLALLLFSSPGEAQTCLKDNGGCGPPPDLPQQCFPGIIGGPWSWQDPAEEGTWQFRRDLQSSRNTCEPALGGYFSNCCGYLTNDPPTSPGPMITIFTVGTRVMVAYDAPNLYCGERSLGDWPIGITCNYGANSDADRLGAS